LKILVATVQPNKNTNLYDTKQFPATFFMLCHEPSGSIL